jgi:hypothetical protein
VPNALRVISDAGQNLRIPGGGTGTAVNDPQLGGAGNPVALGLAGAAYTNSNLGGATTTTIYDIDTVNDRLVRQGGVGVPPGTPSPNTGLLFDVGPLGLDVTGRVGFDIAGGSGVAYAALTPAGGAGANLYTIDLATGRATLVGGIGGGSVPVGGLSVVPIPAPPAALLAGLGLVALAARRRLVG